MNKEFVKKMIKSKALELQAFKILFEEYAPQPVLNKVSKQTEEIKDIIKEIVYEVMEERFDNNDSSKCEEDNRNKKNKKINVDFE